MQAAETNAKLAIAAQALRTADQPVVSMHKAPADQAAALRRAVRAHQARAVRSSSAAAPGGHSA